MLFRSDDLPAARLRRALLTPVALPAAVVLLCFTLRRLVFTIAALLPRPEPADSNESLSVTLVVPARNERSVAPATLDALDRLDFPLATTAR